jgi:hypothetical protein
LSSTRISPSSNESKNAYRFLYLIPLSEVKKRMITFPAYPVKPQSATQMDSLGVPSHRHTVHGK